MLRRRRPTRQDEHLLADPVHGSAIQEDLRSGHLLRHQPDSKLAPDSGLSQIEASRNARSTVLMRVW